MGLKEKKTQIIVDPSFRFETADSTKSDATFAPRKSRQQAQSTRSLRLNESTRLQQFMSATSCERVGTGN